ncbi:type I restriction-modification system subunit M [Aeromonas caviae]|uniref:type I restriction-modification system subunit M n=1 Tax=Aeromonas caviae TaxID=648 RepID=UPI001CC7C878|nr:class I SAM-dependent DNA methyltransferase [Aeromonas caviae]BDN91035.1 restriction endonuclease subunit M [Aeromonas caviae]GJA52062.1 restriction endonuclease subunit M [Aeromonas caviae]GJA60892.1 restriction endonuclease subunit M [Aeromonas caviae]GJA69899.1 restriction endonuclease subunit M [Aeromonas caviae]GJA92443.1 restriction endonuclease subunit M [Aeromonas caviae]
MAEQTGSGASLADFIWKNAEDLWGDFKHTDFGKIILPFTLLRRLECVLEPTREGVRETHAAFKDAGIDLDLVLRQATRYPFYNTSEYALGNLGSTKTRQNLQDYIAHFSDNARIIFEQFDFSNTILRLDKAGVLFKICKNFAGIDLHPEAVPDRVMSNLYEHLIRRFGAEVNEGAEDFMTPRDVVHLATALLLDPDDALFESNPGLIRTLYDPTCGTGGFLTDAMNHVAEYGNRFKVPPVLVPHGQELEPETHAVCLTSMLLRTLESDPGRDLSKNIRLGSTLSNDQFANERFHYCLSNPPFGKKWEKDSDAVNTEHKEKKYDGRFGPGLPRINDGSMLFLLHLASKLELPENGGGRAAIVLSGSPLFNGGASSGESEIRRWLLENDLVEAIVALPTEIFFRTGIGTYLWILSNKKDGRREKRVQLINATGFWSSIKNEGNKRRIVDDDQRRQIVDIYAAAENNEVSRMIDYRTFGYRRIKVLRPLRMSLVMDDKGLAKLQDEKVWQKLSPEHQQVWLDALQPHMGATQLFGWAETFADETVRASLAAGKVIKAGKTFIKALVNAFGQRDPQGEPVLDADGAVVSDPELTDYENVPLTEDIRDYLAREVLPHLPDAYIDETFRDDKDKEIGRVGYEINFNRFFYQYVPPRKLHDIDAELKQVESEIAALLAEVATE